MRAWLLRRTLGQVLVLLTLTTALAASTLPCAPQQRDRPSAQGSLLLWGQAPAWGALQLPPQGRAGQLLRTPPAPNRSLFSAMEDSSRRVISARLPVDRRKRRDARLSWVFLGTTVITGGTSMYLKSAADDRYQRYLSAGSPEAMNRYYEEALRLDRYAATAYGTFQISFLLWVFFFLKSR